MAVKRKPKRIERVTIEILAHRHRVSALDADGIGEILDEINRAGMFYDLLMVNGEPYVTPQNVDTSCWFRKRSDRDDKRGRRPKKITAIYNGSPPDSRLPEYFSRMEVFKMAELLTQKEISDGHE